MSDLSNSRVLIVDDTEVNIDILVEFLSDQYLVSVAMDGESALKVISENRHKLIQKDISLKN